MATYSGAPAISASLNFFVTGGGTVTQYTVPANSYAIISVSGQAAGEVRVSGTTMVKFATGEDHGISHTVYVGPGQSIQTVTGGSSIKISGVVFTNIF